MQLLEMTVFVGIFFLSVPLAAVCSLSLAEIGTECELPSAFLLGSYCLSSELGELKRR